MCSVADLAFTCGIVVQMTFRTSQLIVDRNHHLSSDPWTIECFRRENSSTFEHGDFIHYPKISSRQSAGWRRTALADLSSRPAAKIRPKYAKRLRRRTESRRQVTPNNNPWRRSLPERIVTGLFRNLDPGPQPSASSSEALKINVSEWTVDGTRR